MLVPLPRLLAAAILLIGILPLTLTAAEQQKKAENPPDQAAATPVDRYAVPEGDVAALLKFIEELQSYRPTTAQEFVEHRKKALEALARRPRNPRAGDRQAIRRVSESPRHRSSNAPAGVAHGECRGTAEDLPGNQGLSRRQKELERTDLSLAFSSASLLERIGNTELAEEAFTPLETGSRKTRIRSWHAMATKCWDPFVA